MKHPATWKQMKLSDAYWFQEGPGVRKWQFKNTGIKLLNVSNITKDGVLDLGKTDRHLDEDEVEEKYSHFLVDAGDLVIASSGISFDDDELLRTRGVFVDESHLPLCMNTSTIRFKAQDEVSDLSYLRYWLDSFEFRSQITQLVTGIAQKNFGPSHLKQVDITLPPLAEQKRIAAILDQADALRVKRRAALARLDALVQSVFLEMFGDPVTNPMGWEEKTLDDLVDGPVRNGISPSNKGTVGGEVLTLSAITGGHFQPEMRKYAMFDKEFSQDKRIDPRDFLICRGNGNLNLVGTAAFPLVSMPDVAFPDTMIAFRLDETRFEKSYLEIVWKSFHVRNQLESAARTTNGTYKVNQTVLKGVQIPLPPKEKQSKFQKSIHQVQKIRHKMAIELLDNLFYSLQQRAFRGEL